MALRVLPMVLGFCLLFFSYGEENRSHTELQRAELVPVSMTGPGAMQQDEAAVLGLEVKYQNPDIMLMNHRPRLRRYAEKKKKKHNAGAFSPLSMSQDGKKTHNSRTKREGRPKGKKTKLVKGVLKRKQMSPTEKVPGRKKMKKPQPPGVFSVLNYITQDKQRSGGQKEDLDD
ncbi:hypothetical protein PHYPO_G00196600 [Pangasianodon hypophthalmus]|uniref:Uncharacterized protein n=1 Tax=Pangasianodon hypophthalmus TaxID=310915 RepID=A0A5N5PL62_PANHP|nr:hypothetical protein PHYPO_G00196600 [Pangasianodon hypophthalmus]